MVKITIECRHVAARCEKPEEKGAESGCSKWNVLWLNWRP